MSEKERYATIGTWVEVFREEGAELSDTAIRDRIKKAGFVGTTARNSVGRVLRKGFHPESVVRNLVEDLIKPLPQADEDGFFESDGKTYGTIKSFSRALNISEKAIRRRLQQSTLKLIQGKDKTGHALDFYCLNEVRELCSDLLQALPQADEDGFFEIEGKTYGTIHSLSRALNVSYPTIQQRIQQSTLKPIQGKNKIGGVNDFYCLTDVRELCFDLLQTLPQANEDGFLESDGQTYGTIYSLSRALNISAPTIQRRIQQSTLKPIQGKNKIGGVNDFYCLNEIRELCSDRLQTLPQANEDGFLESDGQTYGTIESLSRALGVSGRTVATRIQQSILKSIQGRDKMGRIYDFYCLNEIRELCSDLLQTLPQANEDGFLESDGKTYGTIRSLSRALNISAPIIQQRIQQSILKSIQGKNKTGRIYDFYCLNEAEELCSDLLQTQPQVNADGFFESDGKTYGTIESLARALGVSTTPIRKRIQEVGLKPIQGKLPGGQVYNFYSQNDIKELCADLIAKKSKK